MLCINTCHAADDNITEVNDNDNGYDNNSTPLHRCFNILFHLRVTDVQKSFRPLIGHYHLFLRSVQNNLKNKVIKQKTVMWKICASMMGPSVFIR